MVDPVHDNEVLELFGRCLEIHDTDGLEAAEKFCRSHPLYARELKRRLDLLEGVGLLEAENEEAVPRSVGEFEVLERIGGGGMGVVYRARQSSLGREVALKLVRPDRAWIDQARDRFRREVEAVANLRHPAIVPIYAVGEADGLPWFAMELIEGCTLEQAIEKLRGRDPATLIGADLALAVAGASGADGAEATGAWIYDGSWPDACCRVAAQIAGALEHAHRRGVLHRDVKPANVMLTPAGRVMLVDFGVARMERGEQMTRTGACLGTPAYMPPEQLRGDHVDARADVYSLGATLYQALTLHRAFDNRTEEGLLRDIREGACAPARSRASNVSRDLDVVCRVAMDPDPERRYPSAAALRTDLEAVLSRRSIEARRPAPLVRVRRWMQRHPTTSVAAVLGFLLVVVGPTIYAVRMKAANERTTEALEDARTEHHRAEENYDHAKDALDVMTDLADKLSAVPGLDGVRNGIMDAVLDFHLSLARQKADDPRERSTVADSLRRAARVRSYRGRHEEALVLQGRAIALLETVAGATGAARDRYRLAQARLGRARTLCLCGRDSEARADVDACFELLDSVDVSPRLRRKQRALALSVRAHVHLASGEIVEARAALGECIAAYEAAGASDGPNDLRRELANALIDLADLDDPLGEEHEARGIELLEGVVTDDPLDYDSRTALAGALDAAGRRASSHGRHDEAVAFQRRAIEQLDSLARAFPNVWTLQRNVAILRLNLGITLARMERYGEGLENIAAARAVLEDIMARSPDDPTLRVQVAATLTEGSRIRKYTGDFEGIVDDLERAVELVDSALKTNPDNPAWKANRLSMLANLGDAYLLEGDHEGAFEVCRLFFAASCDELDYYSAVKLSGSCAQMALHDRELDEEERAELMTTYLDAAFAQLDEAIDAGFRLEDTLESSPRLTLVRADPRYPAVAERLRALINREPR